MFNIVSQWWERIQGSLFPFLECELGPLTKKQQQLIKVLEVVRIEEFIPDTPYGTQGRPQKNRIALARSFISKSVLNLPTTRALIDRLESDISLRRICGWESVYSLPGESTFSRAFDEFATSQLPLRVHSALIEKVIGDNVVANISRDSTAINGREKPLRKKVKGDESKNKPKKRGRPKKGEEQPKELTRIERQVKGMSLDEMVKDLPTHCDVGSKRNSKGYKITWNGFKLHIDTIDGDIPVSAILTSASVHDSQVAIPLAETTALKVTSLYDLMDAAYDVKSIKEHSLKLGHKPIIDSNPRRNKELKAEMERENKAKRNLNLVYPEDLRYNQRSSAERVNSRLKDEFGGRTVRVRGGLKVGCHLMFGLLALTADQLFNTIL